MYKECRKDELNPGYDTLRKSKSIGNEQNLEHVTWKCNTNATVARVKVNERCIPTTMQVGADAFGQSILLATIVMKSTQQKMPVIDLQKIYTVEFLGTGVDGDDDDDAIIQLFCYLTLHTLSFVTDIF